MKLYKLRRIEYYSMMCEIGDALGKEHKLTTEQRSKLSHHFERRKKGRLYEEVTSTKQTNFLWRITTPIYCIVYLLMLLFAPVKWIFTGKFRYGFSDKNIMVKWGHKLGVINC